MFSKTFSVNRFVSCSFGSSLQVAQLSRECASGGDAALAAAAHEAGSPLGKKPLPGKSSVRDCVWWLPEQKSLALCT